MKKRGAIYLFVLLTIIVILSFGAVYSETDNSQENLERAYQCIRDKIGTDCSKLSSENQAFSILALGDYENCRASYLSNSRVIGDGECWPKENCNPKDTAMAWFVLRRLGRDTTPVERWLLTQTRTASDLIWFIQIESDEQVQCSVNYGGQNYEFQIFENKKISTRAGNCLSLSAGNYWFEISPESPCIDYQYNISCDNDFRTTLLYKTRDSPTIHVSQNVNFNSAGGETTEKISYECFKRGTVCDYESSLWASLALSASGRSVGKYVPYLESQREERQSLFPESFLYIMSPNEDYLNTLLVTNFKNNQYWSAGLAQNRFYDSALGFLAVGSRAPEKADLVMNYLLGNQQGTDGCWNNVRDTGLLLYSGWDLIYSIPPVSAECSTDIECGEGKICEEGRCLIGCRDNSNCLYLGEDYVCFEGNCIKEELLCETDEDCDEDFFCHEGICTNQTLICITDLDCEEGFICDEGNEENVCRIGCRNNTGCPSGFICDMVRFTCIQDVVPTPSCQTNNYYCMGYYNCLMEADGMELRSYSCPGVDICCDSPLPQIPTCSEKNGYLCESDEICAGSEIVSRDSKICCNVQCIPKETNGTPPTPQYTCVSGGGTCRGDCLSNERIDSFFTCPSNMFCCKSTDSQEGGSYFWIIIILIILILIIALLIVFRDRVSMFLFKLKGKFGKGSSGKPTMPGPPGRPPVRPIPPRQFAVPSRPPMQRPPVNRPPVKKDSEFDETLKKLQEMSK